MAWNQSRIDRLVPRDKTYWIQEDNLEVKIQPTGHVAYYCYIRRKHVYLGTHPELTLRQAKKKKVDMYADMYMGKLEESKLTFEQFVHSDDFTDWSKDRATHAARMACMQSTILPVIGKVKLAKLNKLDVTRYKNKRKASGVSESTINRELNDISGVITQAHDFELIRQKIKIEKYKEDKGKERRTLEEWEVKALRKSASSTEGLNQRQIDQKKHIPLFIDIGLFCGLRRGEILALKWGDIVDKGHFKDQWKEGGWKLQITDGKLEEPSEADTQAYLDASYSDFAFRVEGATTKTKQTRLVPIAKELVKALKGYYTKQMMEGSEEDFGKLLEDNSFLGIHPDHRDIRIFPFTSVQNAFSTARKNAGLDNEITLHSLRHHFCTKALESGMSLHCVKDLAGHASIVTTERYLHANPKVKFEQYQMFESLMNKEIN